MDDQREDSLTAALRRKGERERERELQFRRDKADRDAPPLPGERESEREPALQFRQDSKSMDKQREDRLTAMAAMRRREGERKPALQLYIPEPIPLPGEYIGCIFSLFFR